MSRTWVMSEIFNNQYGIDINQSEIKHSFNSIVVNSTLTTIISLSSIPYLILME